MTRTLPLMLAFGALFAPSPVRADAPARSRTDAAPALLPRSAVRFEANRGQADPSVRFIARTRRYTGFLTDRGLVLSLPEGGPRDGRPGRSRIAGLSMEFEGGGSRPAGFGRPEGFTTRFAGRGASRRTLRSPNHAGAVAPAVWPGIDVEWTAERGSLRYSFLVRPGASPGDIGLSFRGMDSLRVDPRGNLVLETPFGVVRHMRPVAWQESRGVRTPVEASFVLRSPGVVAFELGPVDAGLPVVVDPVIEYSSYLGGTGSDELVGVATDSTGAVYVAGNTWDSTLPVVGGFRGKIQDVASEVYVAKWNPAGDAIVYSTYLGGTLEEYCFGIQVDSSGRAWVAGVTFSTDFPTASAFQSTLKGYQNAFLSRISADGDELEISTYFGGEKHGNGNSASTDALGLALDTSGNAYIAGLTDAEDLPTKDPFQATFGGGSYDVFVAKFTTTGSLAYASYLGGNQSDIAYSLVVDAQARPYVVGATWVGAFPAVNPLSGITGVGYDAFLVRLASDGKSVDYAFHWGGNNTDEAKAVALGPTGEVFVAGTTKSPEFPLKDPLMVHPLGSSEKSAGFLTRFDGGGTALQYSTYLGTINATRCYALAVDSAGGAWLGGDANAHTNFPLVKPVQSTVGGARDAFLMHLNPAGSSILFSTVLGGSGVETAKAIALDGDGAVLCAGVTTSNDFPAVSSLDGSFGGGGEDGFLARISTGPAAPTTLLATAYSGTTASLSWADNSSDELGFTLQRRLPGGTFATVGGVGPGVTSMGDGGLAPLTSYEYRVQAYNDAAASKWSNVAGVTTPDVPPAAPTVVSAVPLSPTSVRVTWTDNSANEASFEVLHRLPGNPYATIPGLAAGTTTHDVAGLLPARTYGFTVRGRNAVGAGSTQPDVPATTDATAAFTLVKGSLNASGKFLKDKAVISGVLSSLEASPDGVLDPVADGLVLRIGGESGPLSTVTIPPGSPDWAERKGRFTWKSARGLLPKVVVTFTPATGAFAVNISKVDFAGAVAMPFDLWFAIGNDAGAGSAEWQEAKPGSWRFPAR